MCQIFNYNAWKYLELLSPLSGDWAVWYSQISSTTSGQHFMIVKRVVHLEEQPAHQVGSVNWEMLRTARARRAVPAEFSVKGAWCYIHVYHANSHVLLGLFKCLLCEPSFLYFLEWEASLFFTLTWYVDFSPLCWRLFSPSNSGIRSGSGQGVLAWTAGWCLISV